MKDDELKTRLATYKSPKWFDRQLKKAMEAKGNRPKRNATQILIESACKVEKFKKPKKHKFRKGYESRGK